MTTDTHPAEHLGMSCADVEKYAEFRTNLYVSTRRELEDLRADVEQAETTAQNRRRRVRRGILAELDDARAALAREVAAHSVTRDRLAWREEQATHRLTADEAQAERLAVVAAVEARIRGDVAAVEAVAPRTIAAIRMQAATAIEALADLTQNQPEIAPALRAAILAADTEETPTDD